VHWGDSGVTCMITVRRGSWGTWDRTCPGPASGWSTVCSTRFSMGPGSGSTTAFIELRLARWGEPARERTREDRDSRVHIRHSSCGWVQQLFFFGDWLQIRRGKMRGDSSNFIARVTPNPPASPAEAVTSCAVYMKLMLGFRFRGSCGGRRRGGVRRRCRGWGRGWWRWLLQWLR
jgi:hypothetical protein